MRKGNFLLVIQWRDAVYKSFQLLSGSLWNDPQIKFCSLLSCHKVAKNVLQAHNRRVLEINVSTSNSLSATQHTAHKRPDLLHRKLCMSLYGAKFRKCFYQVHFNHDSPGIVWAWLWFVGVFLIEGEVIAPIPPRVRDRAAVDHSGVMGNLTATCSQSHSCISTSASRLYTNCGWNVRFPLHLHLYCLLNPSTQMLNSAMQLAEPGWASSFVVAEFCGSCTRMTGAFL